MAVDLTPYGCWTLRDKAAQHRIPLCYKGIPSNVKQIPAAMNRMAVDSGILYPWSRAFHFVPTKRRTSCEECGRRNYKLL